MLRRGMLLLIVGLVFLLTSCTMTTSTPTPRSGVVTIERVEFVVLESYPLQVQARITGYLGDGCTTFT
ncbi:MAG: hypothetical protein J7459_17235, partial [Chloroflexus sp.]|nr:hypothetical protein [Chloroflexus sp.]